MIYLYKVGGAAVSDIVPILAGYQEEQGHGEAKAYGKAGGHYPRSFFQARVHTISRLSRKVTKHANGSQKHNYIIYRLADISTRTLSAYRQNFSRFVSFAGIMAADISLFVNVEQIYS
jgi:hypothetical protein